jgi:hypothetical protein
MKLMVLKKLSPRKLSTSYLVGEGIVTSDQS